MTTYRPPYRQPSKTGRTAQAATGTGPLNKGVRSQATRKSTPTIMVSRSAMATRSKKAEGAPIVTSEPAKSARATPKAAQKTAGGKSKPAAVTPPRAEGHHHNLQDKMDVDA